MTCRLLVLYGSYRSDRMGIRLAHFVVDGFRTLGADVELIDAKAVGLPMLDRMYKEHPKGKAPETLERLAGQIREADGFVFITGEYNWGMQPGLKNLTDHFLEEWFWRPAAIASYSAGRLSGRPDRADPVGRRQADRRGRQGAGARLSPLCRRSPVVGGSRPGAAGEEAPALLTQSGDEICATRKLVARPPLL